ncbi:MAG: tyrosine--tRNA ligase [Firmicutes bacterium]|nr:tyrosine--tRNA ligase [Bacillota bacterium]
MNFTKILFDRFNANWKDIDIKSLLRVKARTVLPSMGDIDLKKPQRVKLGIDPTGSEIHIGHLAPLFILDIFARAGHHVDFVIGDFTCKIGDPSGRVSEREILTDAQIAKNLQTYIDQVNRYFDVSRWATPRNSEWLAKITMAELIGITQNLNLATILQRDDFRKRLETGGITMAELMYGIMQGMDSVALKTTIELGGNDQLLNLQQGRELQRIHGQPPQAIIVTPLIEGLCGTGKKMSKSLNNYIAVTATLEDKFGKMMSLPDNLLEQYWTTFGYFLESELPSLREFIKTQPLEAKKQLATYFIAIEAKSIQEGEKQRTAFEKKFSKKELTDNDFIQITAKHGDRLIDVLMSSGKFKSKGDLKRLFISKAIRNLGAQAAEMSELALEMQVVDGMEVGVGRLNFFRIKVV